MKQNQKIGILGYGEVGQAIAKFYGSTGASTELSRMSSPQARIKDLNRDDGLEGAEVLHVCLPWSQNFVKIVKKEIKRIKPELTIVNSTVAPGTTRKIGGMVVHSPVRGVHPYLFLGIKTFVKYVGADNKKAGKAAQKHLESLGIKTRVFYPALTTEIGKLFDTSFYGLVIAWHGEMKKICDKYGIDFEQAVTDFNQTYNEGYLKLGKKNVVRPVLYPPKSGIGGHCIIENAKILKKYAKSRALDLILDYKPNKKRK
jgi:UDP-N-acetyl-D-mannosaminuronate dehydrogenase